MEIGKNFCDLVSYNENMTKGMEDKLWFLKHLDADHNYIFVDFGCADGTLINILTQLDETKNSSFIGYDISETMIDLAKTKFSWEPDSDVNFFTKWDDVVKEMNYKKSHLFNSSKVKKVLILSSVIHEVFSYGTDESIKEFFDNIQNSGFDYIFVRDMMVSKDANRVSANNKVANIRSIAKENCVTYATMEKYVRDFEMHHGSIENNLNLMHFLLKYRWKINWEREVNENYFPIFIEDFLKKMEEKYNINYLERFRVPYLDECIFKDFGIRISDYTHVKMFFEIKKF